MPNGWKWGGAVAAIAAVALASAADAQNGLRTYDIAEQPLDRAIASFADQSGRELVVDAALLAGKRSGRVAGPLPVRMAIDRLLAGTGLVAREVDGAFVITAARAQRADQVRSESDDGDIVVTGTRIRGAAPVGSPLIVLDRAAIERSGRGTIADIFQAIPQNFGGGPNEATSGTTARNGAGSGGSGGSSINLRGLGTGSTLVLIDGNRPALAGGSGTFTDISLIPQVAIERIEILTDGASAIYGSDAVAGVVNLRLRNRFEGFETWARTGTADGDFTELQLGQIAGTRWPGGGVTLAYQYEERGALVGAKRPFSTEDLRPYGGPDGRSLFATPGTIIAANGAVFGIPAGQDGRDLAASDLIPGQQNRRNARRTIDLLPERHSQAGFASIEQTIAGDWTLYARGLYARRTTDATRPPGALSVVTVPVTNAFYVDPIGTNQPVRVRYAFATDLGLPETRSIVDGMTASAGITGTLGSWRIDVAGSYGRQIEHDRSYNLVNSARLAQRLADSDPLTAFNVFADRSVTPRATIDYVRGDTRSRSRYAVWTASARADGPLFELPGGTVRLAVGAEHRDERLDSENIADVRLLEPEEFDLSGLPASRTIDALYAELLVPLVKEGGWFPGDLDLALAGRVEHYSDVGRSTNPKVGLAWRPLRGVALRGSYSRSFRAPEFRDLAGTGGNLYQTVVLDDPLSPSGTSVVLGLFGLSDNIGPERADSWTAGIDIDPRALPGVTASATYFDIRYRDRIGSVSVDYLNFLTRRDLYAAVVDDDPDVETLARYFDDPLFFDPLGVTPADIDAIVDGLTRNLSVVNVRGVDLDLGYERAVAGGTAAVGLAGTYLIAIDQQITATAPAINVVSTLGNPVDLRLRGRLSWSKGGFDAGGFVNYLAGYTNQTRNPNERVASWTTFDAQIGYSFARPGPLDSARIALSATNLFDRNPPFVINQAFDSTLGYDPEQASPVGRLIALQLRLGW